MNKYRFICGFRDITTKLVNVVMTVGIMIFVFENIKPTNWINGIQMFTFIYMAAITNYCRIFGVYGFFDTIIAVVQEKEASK